MDTRTAIRVENLSKSYRMYDSPLDRLKESLHPLRKKYHRDFFALRDVSFEIEKGATVGIVGKNGSGKSTLLKIITGVLTPTSGAVTVNGRVSALLELGTGFNMELTGIENVYFSGTIMGYTKEEMDGKLDPILSFADIGEFANQPLKTYSSGMYVRLAFAVATYIDPEILIVDEALAVGDMFFQAKCMTKMKKMMDDGATILFVSHDMGTVKSLCKKAVLLECGAVAKNGSASEVADFYMRETYNKSSEELKKEVMPRDAGEGAEAVEGAENDGAGFEPLVSTECEADLGGQIHRFGTGEARLLDLKLLNWRREEASVIDFKKEFHIQASVLFRKKVAAPCLGYQIKDLKGIEIIGSTTAIENIRMPMADGLDVMVIEFKTRNILAPGIYSISFGIEEMVENNFRHIVLEAADNAVVFEISNPESMEERFWTRVHIPVEAKYFKTAKETGKRSPA